MADPAFSDMIRKWTAADTQIRNLNNQLRDLRSSRDSITTEVCDYMKTKGLDKRKIEVETIVVSGNRDAMDEMIAISGQSKAPTMDWHGEVLADFGVDELVPFLKQRGVI